MRARSPLALAVCGAAARGGRRARQPARRLRLRLARDRPWAAPSPPTCSDFSAGLLQPGGARARARLRAQRRVLPRRPLPVHERARTTASIPVQGLVGGRRGAGQALRRSRSRSASASTCPDDRLARVRALAQDQPRWELYDNRNQRLWFGVNLAISPTPWLQLGGGITLMAATHRESRHQRRLRPAQALPVVAAPPGHRRPDAGGVPRLRRAGGGGQVARARPRLPRAVPDGPERRGEGAARARPRAAPAHRHASPSRRPT